MFRFKIIILTAIFAIFAFAPLQAQDEEETIPDPMPMVVEGEDDIVNFLLIGTATDKLDSPGLADSLLIASVNRTRSTASILSIPRDIYVYIPGFGMDKINTAYFYGELRDPDHTGVELLKIVIEYNLGIEIDYYARVNFTSFGQIIDSLGGITITVDCALQDWRLKEPGLDIQVEDNWELATIWAGIHYMDSHTALWYVRSRRTSTDLDRGRRQQDVLRAIWRKIRSEGLLNQLPMLWEQMDGVVDTDLSLTDALGFVSLALDIDTADIEYFSFRVKQEVNGTYASGGKHILQMDREAVVQLMQQVVLPPNASQLTSERPTVAVIDNSGMPAMAYVAADRLELEGFRTEIVTVEAYQPREYNHIVDYTGASKGNPVSEIQRVLRVTDEGIQIEPTPDREYDFVVYIGMQYPTYSCTRAILPPKPLDENGNVIEQEA